jgi:hypothetical protein
MMVIILQMYLHRSINRPLILEASNNKKILEASNNKIIKWWVDASFTVRSHTGGAMSMVKGVIYGTCFHTTKTEHKKLGLKGAGWCQ